MYPKSGTVVTEAKEGVMQPVIEVNSVVTGQQDQATCKCLL